MRHTCHDTMRPEKVSIPEPIARVATETVDEGRRMILRAYGFIPVTEVFIRDFVKKVLGKFSRPDLTPAIAMILKELTVNAAKANFKRLMFEESQIDVDNPEDLERGMQIFRDNINETMAFEYGKKAREASLNVVTSFDFDENRVIIEVRNNLAMSREEEARVRDKLRQAMACDNIAEFIMENVDETEGAGLGIILSLSALKTSGIDPHALTISTNFENETIARVEIPLSNKYQLMRRRAHDPQESRCIPA